MPARLGIALSALAILLLAAGPPDPVPSVFEFDPGARPLLHQLWQSSLAAKAERVACLAATIEGDTVRISDVLPLDPARSDSLGVAASASLETCGPSRWL